MSIDSRIDKNGIKSPINSELKETITADNEKRATKPTPTNKMMFNEFLIFLEVVMSLSSELL